MAKNSIDAYGASGKTNVLMFEPENLHLVSGIEVIVKGSLERLHGFTSFQPVAADLADTKTARAIALFSPANVHTLVEALELKEEQRANWSQMAQKLGEDLDAAEKRIAELESRTVTINTPDARDEDYDWDGQTPSEAFNTCRMICALMFRQSLRAAGIKVEAE